MERLYRSSVTKVDATGRQVSWRAQVTRLLVALIFGTLVLALAGVGVVMRGALEQQAAERAVAIARSVAADPRYAAWVMSEPPSATGPAQAAAEGVRERTGALYVVIMDAQGIRYSHPNGANVGDRVSTDPGAVLAGEDVVELDRGTLGTSARGKVPLRDASGTIIGAVSVGVASTDVDAVAVRLGWTMLGVGAVALAVGVLALVPVGSRLRRATHGLESDELADLLREHAAVADGALDGVVSVDAHGRVRGANDAARRLVGGGLALGASVEEAGLPRLVTEMLGPDEVSTLAVAHGRVLQVRCLPVERAGRDLGWVLVLRDRTDLDELSRELEATRALTDALRAQTHEHANRLHALTGLLQLGHHDAARSYLADLSTGDAWAEAISDPFLAGLLAGKEAAASEAGVELRLADASWVNGRLGRPLDCVTVVGNLIDNAIRAAASGSREPWVEVTLVRDGADLVAHVIDSGEGLLPEQSESIFTDGWTTKADGAGHGLGLALARVTARRHGGDLTLASRGAPEHGAAFTARLAAAFEEGQQR